MFCTSRVNLLQIMNTFQYIFHFSSVSWFHRNLETLKYSGKTCVKIYRRQLDVGWRRLKKTLSSGCALIFSNTSSSGIPSISFSLVTLSSLFWMSFSDAIEDGHRILYVVIMLKRTMSKREANSYFLLALHIETMLYRHPESLPV